MNLHFNDLCFFDYSVIETRTFGETFILLLKKHTLKFWWGLTEI